MADAGGDVTNDLNTLSPVERPSFVYWVSLWFAASAHAYVGLFRDIFLSEDIALRVGRDFTNLWTAGRMVLNGEGPHAYNVDVFRLELLDRVGILSLQNFSYPPHALFLDAVFALPPYPVAFVLWIVFSASAFILAARPYLPQGFPPVLAALTPAATICMWGGQFGLLIGALWLVVYRNCDRRPVQAGLAAAALTIKPHLGLLVAVLLITRRKALITAILASLALFVVSGLAFGWYSWASFLVDTTRDQADILTRTDVQYYFNLMPTVFPHFGRGWLSWVLQAASAGFAIHMLWRLRGLSPMQLAFPAATATFLILPYGFNYDMTVVALGFALLLFEHWARLSMREKVILTLGFVSPQLGFIWAPIVPVALALAFYVQCQQLLRQNKDASLPNEPRTLAVVAK